MILLSLILSVTAWSFDWQGHRGARGLYPENTVGAMREALKYPVTTLEVDLAVSSEGDLIVSHEPWMNPEICLHPEGKSYKEKEYKLLHMKSLEIMAFDCGSKVTERFPEQQKVSTGKPRLRTLIEQTELELKDLKDRKISYNIEIKSSPEFEKEKLQPEVEEFSDLVLKEVTALLPYARFTIQSFDPRVLKYIHEKDPKVTLSYLIEGKTSPREETQSLGFVPQIYSPSFKELTREKIEEAHSLKMKVIPWTVNDVQKMRELRALGVDGIITDYPNRISEALGPECKKGFSLYAGACVLIPKHAQASLDNPGWVCKNGYHQARDRCTKIHLPHHSVLLEDGKTWACKPKFERYRGTCRRIPVLKK